MRRPANQHRPPTPRDLADRAEPTRHSHIGLMFFEITTNACRNCESTTDECRSSPDYTDLATLFEIRSPPRRDDTIFRWTGLSLRNVHLSFSETPSSESDNAHIRILTRVLSHRKPRPAPRAWSCLVYRPVHEAVSWGICIFARLGSTSSESRKCGQRALSVITDKTTVRFMLSRATLSVLVGRRPNDPGSPQYIP